MTTLEMRQKRAGIVDEARAFWDGCNSGRSPTKTERDKFDAMLRQSEELAGQIGDEARGLSLAETEKHLNASMGRQIERGQPGDFHGVSQRAKPLDGNVWVDERGNKIKALSPDERFADLNGGRGLSFGNWLRASITGEPKHRDAAEPEFRALGEAGFQGGANMVSPQLASEVIDLARNRTTVVQAGARTIPMATEELRIARLTADPSGAWRQELATISEDTAMTLGAIVLKARSHAAIVRVSMENLMDAPNIGGTINNALAQSMAVALDLAALYGGAGGNAAEPIGIFNAEDVLENASIGALSVFDDFLDSAKQCWDANEEPTAVIYSPRERLTIAKAKDGQGLPLKVPAEYERLNKFSTGQIPVTLGAGSNESFAIVGDFSQLLLGIRTGFQVQRIDQDSTSLIWQRYFLLARLPRLRRLRYDASLRS